MDLPFLGKMLLAFLCALPYIVRKWREAKAEKQSMIDYDKKSAEYREKSNAERERKRVERWNSPAAVHQRKLDELESEAATRRLQETRRLELERAKSLVDRAEEIARARFGKPLDDQSMSRHLNDRDIERMAVKALRQIDSRPPDERDQAWESFADELSRQYGAYVAEEALQKVNRLRGLDVDE